MNDNPPRWLTACAWCRRIRLDDRWVGEIEAVQKLERFEGAPRLTHTICERCLDELLHGRARGNAAA